MIFSQFRHYAIMTILLVGGTIQTGMSAPLQQDIQSQLRLQTILSVNAEAPINTLTSAVNQLEALYKQYPDYRIAKMFYGYGQLFIATDFLVKKNYLRAAEASKLGFFYIDEAAETDENDWKMRFLRARMDSFVPAAHGRCVVALKDLDYLQQNPAVPARLKPMLTLMSAHALGRCQRQTDATTAWAALKQLGDEGTRLAGLSDRSAPEWSPTELALIIEPLAETAL